jgi:flagellar motor component MotA
MNSSAVAGTSLTVGALVAGAMFGQPLHHVIDLPSVFIVLVPLPFVLMLSHSQADLKTYGWGGLRMYLSSSAGTDWGPHERLKAARIATSAGTLAMLLGAAGTYIGCIQMLQNMEDTSDIGPALAVAILTVFYGLVINALVCMPIARHHQLAALEAGAAPDSLRQDHPLRNVLIIVALLGCSIGLSTFAMLFSLA